MQLNRSIPNLRAADTIKSRLNFYCFFNSIDVDTDIDVNIDADVDVDVDVDVDTHVVVDFSAGSIFCNVWKRRVALRSPPNF